MRDFSYSRLALAIAVVLFDWRVNPTPKKLEKIWEEGDSGDKVKEESKAELSE